MGQRRKRFRLTKRGKIVVALLSTTLIFAGVAVLKWHPEIKILLGSNSNGSIVSASADDDKNESTIERIYVSDSDVKSTNKTLKIENNPKNNNNTAGNNSTGPEIDEEFFSRALFIGDSITEGISAYGLLNGSNILAAKGLTILKAEKEMDKIVNKHPEKIYILLGSNDMLYGMDSEKFTTDYIEFIQHIKDKLPAAKIYIQSIFPVSRDIESEKPLLSNSRIDEFNITLKRKAEEQGIGFIDISYLLKDGSGIMNKDYTSDGIHVKYKFYSIWLDCVKKNS